MQQSGTLSEAITQKETTDACVAYNSKSKKHESETEQVKSHKRVSGLVSFENHGEGKKNFLYTLKFIEQKLHETDKISPYSDCVFFSKFFMWLFATYQ